MWALLTYWLTLSPFTSFYSILRSNRCGHILTTEVNSRQPTLTTDELNLALSLIMLYWIDFSKIMETFCEKTIFLNLHNVNFRQKALVLTNPEIMYTLFQSGQDEILSDQIGWDRVHNQAVTLAQASIANREKFQSVACLNEFISNTHQDERPCCQ